MPVQVEIDSNTGIAVGISETKEEIVGNEYIKIDEFDTSILGKKWNGKSWDVVEQDDIIEDLITPEHGKTKYSVLEFLKRFSLIERETIKNVNNSRVQDFLFSLSVTSEVDLEDPSLIENLNYMTTINKEGYSQEEFVDLFLKDNALYDNTEANTEPNSGQVDTDLDSDSDGHLAANFVPILSAERVQHILTP